MGRIPSPEGVAAFSPLLFSGGIMCYYAACSLWLY